MDGIGSILGRAALAQTATATRVPDPDDLAMERTEQAANTKLILTTVGGAMVGFGLLGAGVGLVAAGPPGAGVGALIGAAAGAVGGLATAGIQLWWNDMPQ